jgi:pimeloyl-ACP methyl ester carboxylesterase
MKTLLGLLAVPAMAYAAICTWMYVQQRELVYFPQFTLTAASETNFALARDDATLRGWVVNAGRPDPILYFGGNAERIEDNRDEFAQWFPGHSVYLVAYRGYGASDGTPSEPALFADALALYDEIRKQHPGQPITVVGRSLGSGVASYLASRRPVAGLVLVTPFDSLSSVGQAHYRWLPVKWLSKDRYESTRHLSEYHGPLLVIRAGQDEVIPAANTQQLIDSLARPPRIVDLPHADHNSVGAESAYARALAEFVAARPSP